MKDKNTLNVILSLYQLLGDDNKNIDCNNLNINLENLNNLQNVNSCINNTYSQQSNVIEACGLVENNLMSNFNKTVNDCIITNSQAINNDTQPFNPFPAKNDNDTLTFLLNNYKYILIPIVIIILLSIILFLYKIK
jgi:hypothetical protein